MFKNLLLLIIIILPINLCWADCPSYWTAAYKAMEGCDGGGGSSVPVYTGPTPEQIKQQKEEAEQKDLNEAAQDADDKGISAYKNGDWSAAVRYFKQAHDVNPDDPDIQTNLDRAQQKVNAAARENDAARQLQAIAQVHPVDNVSAQIGFDTPVKAVSDIITSNIAAPEASSGSKDPVVPESKRTPAITAMEENRKAFRERITKLDETLKTTDPAKDPVLVAKLKQEQTDLGNKVHYLNFSIGEIVNKPAQDKVTPVVPSK